MLLKRWGFILNRLILLFGLGIILLLVSIFSTLYEGSEIIIYTDEWAYSTPFTHLFKGEVIFPEDILHLDYLVFAAKFKPFFPILALISIVYLLTLIGYVIFKHNCKWFNYFLFFIGSMLFVFSLLLSNSVTIGGITFFKTSLSMSILYITIALILWLIKKKNVTKKDAGTKLQ